MGPFGANEPSLLYLHREWVSEASRFYQRDAEGESVADRVRKRGQTTFGNDGSCSGRAVPNFGNIQNRKFVAAAGITAGSVKGSAGAAKLRGWKNERFFRLDLDGKSGRP